MEAEVVVCSCDGVVVLVDDEVAASGVEGVGLVQGGVGWDREEREGGRQGVAGEEVGVVGEVVCGIGF